MSGIVLSADELVELTGYKRPSEQLKALHRQGFYRARLNDVTRTVTLERAHYLAVCADRPAANSPTMRPRVQHG